MKADRSAYYPHYDGLMDSAKEIGGGPAPDSRLSLLIKIARMYHEQGLRQPEIAEQLRVSQSRVSRSLKEATALGVIRTVVVPPPGFHPELEDGVRDAFGLADVVVAQTSTQDEREMLPALGVAAATYLEMTIQNGDRIGISSWSASLIATVEAMSPLRSSSAAQVVQLLGGVGEPRVQLQATRLVEQFALRTGATPQFFHAPGIVGSEAARDALLADPYIGETTAAWEALTLAVVGIGSLQPSPLLRESGNAIPRDVVDALQRMGAVGDICLRFFDRNGDLVDSDVNRRVLGISVPSLLSVPRKIGVAGGSRKYEAIRAAVKGHWIDVLITDAATAQRLIEDQS